MQDIRCAFCGFRRPREQAVQYGLRWVCDYTCFHSEQEKTRDLPLPSQAHRQAVAQKGVPLPTQGSKVSRVHKTRTEPSHETKLKVKARDGECCRFCGTSRDIHVHHIEYRSQGGGHSQRNLLSLCGACHAVVHSSKYHWQPVLVELMRLHYEEDRFLNVLQVEHLMTPPEGST